MRVSQVQSLLWTANVLLLGATGWVGWQFWQTKKAQTAVQKTEWPSAVGDVVKSDWPGPLDKFDKIWKTPISGVVPPPPEVAKPAAAVRLDPAEELKKKLKIESGILGVSAPGSTTMTFSWSGKPITLKLGAILEDNVDGKRVVWQFTEIASKGDGSVAATFYSRDYEKNEGRAIVETTFPVLPTLTAGGVNPWKRTYDADGPVVPDISKDKIPEQTFQDAKTGEWRVPQAEIDWMEAWGEELVLGKLKTQDATAPDGTRLGVKLMSSPGEGTAVSANRGLSQGDVLKSINGTPVRSMADVARYLKDAKGVTRFVVVIERNGAEKTIVYSLMRRAA
jgi:hypothetical protein